MRYEGIRLDKNERLLRFLNFKAEYDPGGSPVWHEIYRSSCIPYCDTGIDNYFDYKYSFTTTKEQDDWKLVSTTYFIGSLRFTVKNSSASNQHGGFCFIYYDEDNEKYCTKAITEIDSKTYIYVNGINYLGKEFYEARTDYPNINTFYNIITNKSGFYDLCILTIDTDLDADQKYTEVEMANQVSTLYDNDDYDFELCEYSNYPLYPDNFVFFEDINLKNKEWYDKYINHVRHDRMNEASNLLYNSGISSYNPRILNQIEQRLYQITEIESSGSEHAMGNKPHIVTYGSLSNLQTGMNYVCNNSFVGHTVSIVQGTGIASTTGAGTYTVGETVNLSATVSTGYTFDEWTTDNPTVHVVNNQFIMPAQNIIVTASATPNAVTITYSANGGSNAPSSTTHYYGTSSALAGVGSMSKGTDVFIGWSETIDGAVIWQPQETSSVAFGYANVNPINTQTLYAVWETKSPGLYQTGTNNLIMSWEDLIDDSENTPIIGVSGSTIESIYLDNNNLSGDLVLPFDIDTIEPYDDCGSTQGLTGIEMPYVTSILGSTGYAAFGGCINLTYVVLPDEVDVIGDGAFYGCTSLENITGLNSANTIENLAFEGTSIEEFECTVGDIYINAFKDCSSLTELTLNITNSYSAEQGCLDNCSSLSTINLTLADDITIDEWNSTFIYGSTNVDALEEVNFGQGTTVIPHEIFKTSEEYGYQGEGISFTLPNTVTEIEYEAFCYLPITNINIPASITTIGNRAFYNCRISNISVASRQTSISNIGEEAFYGSYFANNFVLPNISNIGYNAFSNSNISSINCTIETIGDYAFDSCQSLTSVILGNGLLSIGDGAFNGCPISLLTIPVSVTNIGSDAFYDCDPDIVVTYGGTIAQWEALDYTFDSFSVIHCSDGDIYPTP